VGCVNFAPTLNMSLARASRPPACRAGCVQALKDRHLTPRATQLRVRIRNRVDAGDLFDLALAATVTASVLYDCLWSEEDADPRMAVHP